MKYFIVVLSVLAFSISCDSGKNRNSLLPKPGDIKADEYVTSIDKDTTLITKNGV